MKANPYQAYMGPYELSLSCAVTWCTGEALWEDHDRFVCVPSFLLSAESIGSKFLFLLLLFVQHHQKARPQSCCNLYLSAASKISSLILDYHDAGLLFNLTKQMGCYRHPDWSELRLYSRPCELKTSDFSVERDVLFKEASFVQLQTGKGRGLRARPWAQSSTGTDNLMNAFTPTQRWTPSLLHRQIYRFLASFFLSPRWSEHSETCIPGGSADWRRTGIVPMFYDGVPEHKGGVAMEYICTQACRRI